MEKVIIKLEDDWHGNSTEELWAKQWFREDNFQIRNVPFYAKGISLNDIIQTIQVGNVEYFKNVLQKSGHSTYRIFLEDKVTKDSFDQHWSSLENMGCSYEQATNRLYAIDIPPEVDIYKAYSLLEIGKQDNIWDFEEADIGHQLK